MYIAIYIYEREKEGERKWCARMHGMYTVSFARDFFFVGTCRLPSLTLMFMFTNEDGQYATPTIFLVVSPGVIGNSWHEVVT